MDKIKIRWIDGFCRIIDCESYQMGKDNYWFKLRDGSEKWVPRENVRSVTIVDTEKKSNLSEIPKSCSCCSEKYNNSNDLLQLTKEQIVKIVYFITNTDCHGECEKEGEYCETCDRSFSPTKAYVDNINELLRCDENSSDQTKKFLLDEIGEILDKKDEEIIKDNYLLGRLYAFAEACFVYTGDVSKYVERIHAITSKDIIRQ